MNEKREFDNILDECLERVMRGEDIRSCLARYPEYAAELEPLLETASDTMHAVDIKPRPEFRQRAAYEFQAAIRDMPVKESRGFFKWQLRWVAPLAIVIVVLAAGSGTVIAAGNSLPDEPLYKVKLATEAVQLAFTPSDLGKAELYAEFADTRVEEIVELANKGEAKQIDVATDRMNNQLVAMANLTGNNAGISGETATAMLQAPASMTYESADMQAKQAPAAPALEPVPAAIPTSTEPAEATSPPVAVTVPPPPESTVVVTEPETVTAPPPQEDTNVAQSPTTLTPIPESREKAPMFAASETLGAAEDSGAGELQSTHEKDEKFDRQEKLKNTLSRKIREHLEKLQKELEKAPDELKPALQRAIEVIINGYETNLNNLR